MNVAIPKIATEYQLSPATVSWVPVIFSLFFGLSALVYGKLIELHTIRRLMTIGISIFLVGSVIGALNLNYSTILFARAVQAIGSGAIPALNIVIASRYFPANRRGRVFAMLASTIAIGGAIGPVVGGFLSETFGWESLFVISLFIVLGLPFFIKNFTQQDKVNPGRFDLIGAILFLCAVANILLGIHFSIWLLLASIGFFVTFTIRLKYVKEPFIDPRTLINRGYLLLLTTLTIGNAAYLTSIFLIPIILFEINGTSLSTIGLVLLPGAALSALLGPVIGRTIDMKGAIIVNKSSYAIMAISFICLSTVVGLSPGWYIPLLILISVGNAGNMAALNHSLSQILTPQQLGTGSGLYNLTMFLSGALGVAISGRFVELDSGHWNILTPAIYSAFSNVFLILGVSSVVCFALVVQIQKNLNHVQAHAIDR